MWVRAETAIGQMFELLKLDIAADLVTPAAQPCRHTTGLPVDARLTHGPKSIAPGGAGKCPANFDYAQPAKKPTTPDSPCWNYRGGPRRLFAAGCGHNVISEPHHRPLCMKWGVQPENVGQNFPESAGSSKRPGLIL